MITDSKDYSELVERLRHRAEIGVQSIFNGECADAIEALLAERDALAKDVAVMKGFADLWYFVMDEIPREFEKIVAEYQPAQWMHEAAKRKAAMKGASDE